MSHPQHEQGEDEATVLDFHPHWSTQLKTILTVLLVLAVGAVAIYFIPDGDAQTQIRLGVAGAAAVLMIVLALVPFLRWYSTRYILTTSRFTLREGIITRSGRSILLNRVNDVSYTQNLIERMLGTGTLAIESASESGQLVLRSIPRVRLVKDEMYRLIETIIARGQGTGYHGPPQHPTGR